MRITNVLRCMRTEKLRRDVVAAAKRYCKHATAEAPFVRVHDEPSYRMLDDMIRAIDRLEKFEGKR